MADTTANFPEELRNFLILDPARHKETPQAIIIMMRIALQVEGKNEISLLSV